jgi:hypothetical protein
MAVAEKRVDKDGHVYKRVFGGWVPERTWTGEHKRETNWLGFPAATRGWGISGPDGKKLFKRRDS